MEPVEKALSEIKKDAVRIPRSLLMTPQGVVFNQKNRGELSQKKSDHHVCGRYEGVDSESGTSDRQGNIHRRLNFNGRERPRCFNRCRIRFVLIFWAIRNQNQRVLFSSSLDTPVHRRRPIRGVGFRVLMSEITRIDCWRKTESLRKNLSEETGSAEKVRSPQLKNS
jgi:hypothetical protein